MVYKLFAFDDNIETFERTIIESLDGNIREVCKLKQKSQFFYLHSYLKEIGTRTILLEKPYRDNHYFIDFINYYSFCFKPYSRICSRLHVFNTNIDDNLLNKYLEGDESDSEQLVGDNDLRKKYLGFIIIKPLPDKIIGRTCLANYSGSNSRFFPTVIPYKVHILGISFQIESLAFQEQDSETAACASIALWTLFQNTGYYFHHNIPSPYEITKNASEIVCQNILSRDFPSEGLHLFQMIHALKKVGLDYFPLNPNDSFTSSSIFLKSAIYAYLQSKIPIILAILIFERENHSYSYKGCHSVTITGFSLNPSSLLEDREVNLYSTKLSKIYVHDDQVGPFARMEIKDIDTNEEDIALSIKKFLKDSEEDSLPKTYFTTSFGTPYMEYIAFPYGVIFPVYNRVRISFQYIYEQIFTLVRKLNDYGFIKEFFDYPLEWNIFLSHVNDFKKDISKNLSGSKKRNILETEFSKYVWRSICLEKNNKLIEFVFDTTEIKTGSSLLYIINYDEVFYNMLKEIIKQHPEFLDEVSLLRSISLLKKDLL